MKGEEDVEEAQGPTLAAYNPISEGKQQTGLESSAIPWEVYVPSFHPAMCNQIPFLSPQPRRRNQRSLPLREVHNALQASLPTPFKCPKASPNDMAPLTRAEYQRLLQTL